VSGATFDELDFEYATTVAEKAMGAMAKQRVPPTPNNYHLWFKYSLGASSDLKRTIDILISNKRKFDKATNQDLFSSYIGSQATEAAVVHQVSQQLHGVMDSAKHYLTAAIADNRTQMQAMDEVADQSNAGVDPKVLIENLVSELAKATARAAKLEANFAEKSRELDTIRDSLNKSEERARTDTLTGLPNRRALEEFFRQAQIAAMEKDEPLSVLLIDIDYFKKFNDNFGHGVGDAVLCEVARRLQAACGEAFLLRNAQNSQYSDGTSQTPTRTPPGADSSTLQPVGHPEFYVIGRVSRLTPPRRPADTTPLMTRRSSSSKNCSPSTSVGVSCQGISRISWRPFRGRSNQRAKIPAAPTMTPNSFQNLPQSGALSGTS